MHVTHLRPPSVAVSAIAVLIIHAVCTATLPAAERVAGFDELVIYDPGVHDRGLPGVQFVPGGTDVQVEIAPALHIHRFYYNGEKEFQGPLLSGGPTVVVAQHPRTGKQMYIDVQLPSGAPVVRYDKDAITYAFPNQRVVLSFLCFGDESVKVTTVSGHSNLDRLRMKVCGPDEGGAHVLHQSIRDCHAAARKTVSGVIVAGETVAAGAIDRTKAVYEMIPAVRLLNGAADRGVEARAMESLRQAQLRQDAVERRFLPTNR